MIQQEQTISYTDLKPGKIYNREYIGPNEAYGECNGKTTFKVISFTKEELVIRDLFADSGSIFDENLMDNGTTFTRPQSIGENYIIYECDDKSKWFIHKQIMSLEVAIEKSVVTLDQIKTAFSKRNPFTGYNGKPVLRLCANRTTEFPYLTSVAFVFESWEEAKQKVIKIYPEALL